MINTVASDNFKHWVTQLDGKACIECVDMNGKIYYMEEQPDIEPPIHERGRCRILPMDAIYAGNATLKGIKGADWWLDRYGTLPNYYITKQQAKNMGWKSSKGNLHTAAPQMMIGGDIYYNKDGHLPQKTGRIWYEADINYITGKRTTDRVLYSNDGLIFVTYDHYHTFYEII